jgi:fumarate hydratase class II
MEGLDKAIKSEESLTRKIKDRVKSSDVEKSGVDKAVDKSAAKINDALRFTIVFEASTYVEAFNKVKQQLVQKGYKFEKLYNGWTSSGGTYMGINATFKTPKGQQFELQFHTPETFKIKTETHDLYEKARDLSVSETERNLAEKKQIEAYKDVKLPSGVDKIKN